MRTSTQCIVFFYLQLADELFGIKSSQSWYDADQSLLYKPIPDILVGEDNPA